MRGEAICIYIKIVVLIGLSLKKYIKKFLVGSPSIEYDIIEIIKLTLERKPPFFNYIFNSFSTIIYFELKSTTLVGRFYLQLKTMAIDKLKMTFQ